MPVIKVVDQTNKEVGECELSPEVFEAQVKPELLNLVVRQTRANRRQGTHATKTRGFVSGGGAKPWRQKGTGRARAGSNRSPLWVGGGTTFGPAPRSYSFKVNRKVKRKALAMALSSRLASGGLKVVDAINIDEIKTKKMAEVTSALGLRKALIVLDKTDRNVVLSARNLPFFEVRQVEDLSVYDVLRFPELVLSQGCIEAIVERLK